MKREIRDLKRSLTAVGDAFGAATERSGIRKAPAPADRSVGMTEIADDEPITLAKACDLFPHVPLTVSTLRAEAARGRLDIFRLGKRD